MGFPRRQRSRLLDAGLDITPLIDVVFLLVIFLLISTTFKKKHLALELNLPKAGVSEYKITGREHLVRIDVGGNLYLCPNEATKEGTDALGCKSPTKKDDLVAELRRLSEQYPGVRLGVYAGAEVPYTHVLKVVAAATEAGIDLNLPYETEDGKPPPPTGTPPTPAPTPAPTPTPEAP